jgi:hypothetical protein
LLGSIHSTFAGLHPVNICLTATFQQLLDSILPTFAGLYPSTFAELHPVNTCLTATFEQLLDSILSTIAGLHPFNICWAPSFPAQQQACHQGMNIISIL